MENSEDKDHLNFKNDKAFIQLLEKKNYYFQIK